MNKNIEKYWWEGDDFHTVEEGQHFVYKDSVRVQHSISMTEDGKNAVVKLEKLEFARREAIDVLEVPLG